jgi:hypothetical protein
MNENTLAGLACGRDRAKINTSLNTNHFCSLIGSVSNMYQFVEERAAILAARMGMSRSPHVGSEPVAKKLKCQDLRGSVSSNYFVYD